MLHDASVVICGGGVIGVCCAYYLAECGYKTIIVEAIKIAAEASGKAGGFLASDWQTAGELGTLGFKLHADLAKKHNGATKYEYRRLRTRGCLWPSSKTSRRRKRKPEIDNDALQTLPFVDNSEIRSSVWVMGEVSSTAQVTPDLFCKTLVEHLQEKKQVEVVIGTVKSIDCSEKDVSHVELEDGRMLTSEWVVAALGPWTGRIIQLGQREIISTKGHSIVVRPKGKLPNTATFFENESEIGPEIYLRPDGTAYIHDFTEPAAKRPPDPGQVVPTAGVCSKIRQRISTVSSLLASAEVVQEQACLMPVTADDCPPLIGVLKNKLIVAAGHTCWGILTAPATGLMVSELISTGHVSCCDNFSTYNPLKSSDASS